MNLDLFQPQHKDYVPTSPWPNDIALLKLERPIDLRAAGVHVGLACLPDSVDANFTQDACWMSGWGLMNGTY